MPTYEYRCDACDRTFDVVQSFHDDPITECPTCGSAGRKVFGNVGIVFKGSGFYKTDSRSGKSSGSRESTAASGGDSSTVRTDTAPSTSAPSDGSSSPTPSSDSGKAKSTTKASTTDSASSS